MNRLRQCVYPQQGLFEQHLHCTVSHTWQHYIRVVKINIHWLNIQQALANQQKQLGAHAKLHWSTFVQCKSWRIGTVKTEPLQHCSILVKCDVVNGFALCKKGDSAY